jgi:hypothetical protein
MCYFDVKFLKLLNLSELPKPLSIARYKVLQVEELRIMISRPKHTLTTQLCESGHIGLEHAGAGVGLP